MEAQESNIADILYEELDYMYCTNCRFNSEVSEEQCENSGMPWGCEDCYRKYNGWGISKAECDRLAKKIKRLL